MESARADMMADVAGDYRDSLVRLCYNPKFDQEMLQHWVSGTGDFKGSPLKDRLENMERLVFTPLVSEYMDLISRFLVSGGGCWFAGKNLSFADFLVWELLDQHRLLIPGCLTPFPALTRFMARFEELEKIKKYLEDPRYKQFPVWSMRAKYGYYPL